MWRSWTNFLTTLLYFSNNLLLLQNGGKNRKVCFYVTNIQESVKGLFKYYKSEFMPLIYQMNAERILIIPLISQIVCEAESLLLGKGNLFFICQSVLIKWNSRDTRFGFWLINIGWLQKLIARLTFTFSLLKSGFEYICNVFFIR